MKELFFGEELRVKVNMGDLPEPKRHKRANKFAGKFTELDR